MKKIAIMAVLFLLISIPVRVFAGSILFDLPDISLNKDDTWGRTDSTAGTSIAQRFVYLNTFEYPLFNDPATNNICNVSLKIAQSGNPQDNVLLDVYFEGFTSTVPGAGTHIAHASKKAVDLPTDDSGYTSFNLDNCFSAPAGGFFWFVWSRSNPNGQGQFIIKHTDGNNTYWTRYYRYDDATFTWIGGDNFEQEWGMRLESGGPSAKNPVLIIPGIAGTELYNGTDLIWADLNEMKFNFNNDQFITDNLDLDSNGQPIVSLVVGNVIKEATDLLVFKINIFNDLETVLVNNNYKIAHDLFYFPYDWRLNLDNSKDLLRAKIEDIKSQTGAQKVDIIAHSMGGLLVDDYINSYGKSSIDKLIFVGTPHLGAPKSARVLLEGDNVGIPWLNQDRIKEVVSNSSAAYELLPGSSYFSNSQGYIKKSGTVGFLSYQDSNLFLLSNNLSSKSMAMANVFWAKNLENTDFSGIDVYNIAGCSTATEAGYLFKSDNSSIDKIGRTSGDGTVPLGSSDYINIPPNHKFYLKNAAHSQMPSQADVRSAIASILASQPFIPTGNLKNDSSQCNFKGKQLVWKSPVDVHVYDQNNNHSGPIQYGLENSIPGADYQIIDGHKFIFLPTDQGQQYRIEGTGTASGSFDLTITDNNNGQESQSTVFNDVTIVPGSQVRFNISDTSADNQINFDYSNSGQFSTVNASSVLSPSQLDDTNPPVTTTSISGTQGLNGWYKSTVMVNLNASDDNSGVLETRYSVNGGSFISYTSSIPVTSEGTSTIRYYSVDNAGNDEDIKTLTVKIDTIFPEFNLKFDTNQKSFIITSLDSISCTSTDCTSNDQAGNNSVLKFGKVMLGPVYTLSLKSVTYNNQVKDLSSNVFAVNFSTKNGQISTFDQVLLVKNQEIAGIHFDPKTGKSTIITYKNGVLNKEVVVGIRFLQIITNKGKIESKNI